MPQPATVSHKSRLGQQQQHYQFFHSDLIMIVSKKTHDGTAKNAKTIMYCVRRHYLKRSSAYLGIFDDTKIFNKNKFKYLPTYECFENYKKCTNQIFTPKYEKCAPIMKWHLENVTQKIFY